MIRRMIRPVIFLALLASPAMAEDLPYAVGDYLIEEAYHQPQSQEPSPSPYAPEERGCVRVLEISDTKLVTELVAGFSPMFTVDTTSDTGLKTIKAPVETTNTLSSSEGLFSPCETTTLCDVTRFFTPVSDCSGRPAPPELSSQ